MQLQWKAAMKETMRILESLKNFPCALMTGSGAAVLCCVLAGCTVGPKYHRPAMQAPAAYKESPANFQGSGSNPDVKPGPWRVAQPQDAKLRGDWWEIFNEPE